MNKERHSEVTYLLKQENKLKINMLNISKIIQNKASSKLIIQNLDMDVGNKLYLPINVSFLNSP